METTKEMKIRFKAAFLLYRTHDGRLRELRSAAEDESGSAGIHEIHAAWQKLSKAEQDYEAIRQEYAERLLGGCDGSKRSG